MRTLQVVPITLLLDFVLMGWSTPIAIGEEKAVPSRPNVLIILCDDLGYGDLSCYGHPHIKTPNLDQLAKSGIRLTDCYAAAPVCSPSRAGILTGRNPNRSGIYDWIPPGHVAHLKAEETTIAELLQSAGYDTAQVGKWHLNGKFNQAGTPQPGDHGFGYWFATQNNASPRHENPNNFVRNGTPVGKLEGFSSHLVAEEGIRWLKAREDKSKPFFLHVCFHEPHEPVESPDDLVQMYLDSGAAKSRDQAEYFANVQNMDAAVGKLVAALDELNVADETLVFFTSDNGPETLDRYRGANRSHGSPGPLRGMKLHIYDGGIRVPGILRWKGQIKSGQVSDVPVCSVDVLPTLCELAEVKVPNDRPIDGTSLVPLLSGRQVNRSEPLFWWYYRAISPPRVALRDGDWKLVAHWDGPFMQEKANSIGNNVNVESQRVLKAAKLVKFELYNLREDIAESKDVASQNPEVLERLKQATIKKFTAIQKEGPVWDTGEFGLPRKKN